MNTIILFKTVIRKICDLCYMFSFDHKEFIFSEPIRNFYIRVETKSFCVMDNRVYDEIDFYEKIPPYRNNRGLWKLNSVMKRIVNE